MANNVYVGSRYVPLFDGAWSSSKTYEPLTIVEYGNSSYTSKKPVPAGTLPTNTTYWALTGNYNGQIANLQTQINDLANNDKKLFNAINVKYPDSATGLTGATGNGTTDDTSQVNAILQYAMNHDRPVYFPTGTYKISTVTVQFTSSHKGLDIFGDGNTSVILSTSKGIILQNTSEVSVPNYCKVTNLKFRASSTSGTRLLQLINIFNGLVMNCLFENADTGLVLVSNIWGNIINCRFNNMAWAGVYMCGQSDDNRGLYAGNNAVNFYGCVVQGAGSFGMNCIGNSGCNFYGCTSESNGVSGINLLKSGSFNGRGNLISGCWFEYNPSGHITIDTTAAATNCNETVSDCGFIMDSNMTADAVSISGNNGAVLVSGCHFRRLNGTRKSVTYTPNVRSLHNRYSYTPTLDEIEAEWNDIPHCRGNSDGSVLFNTRDITSITRTAAGSYTVTVNHWVRCVSVSSENNGCIASAAPVNNANNTCSINVRIRDVSNMALVDTAFSLIAM